MRSKGSLNSGLQAKKRRGLGVSRLEEWNIIAIMAFIWVAWVQINLLKGKSFWAVKTPQSST